MTFLLFMVSVAVLEYLLRDVRRKSGDVLGSARDINEVADCAASDSSSADLLSLGRALDAQKTGKVPDSEHAPKVSALN